MTDLAQDYYGTKRVTAWPEVRDGTPGFAVRYADGYTSWSPAWAFGPAYQPITAMSFGHALKAMEEGHCVARFGWAKGQLLQAIAIYCDAQLNAVPQGSPDGEWRPLLALVTGNTATPWLPPVADLVADDWTIVEA